MRNQMRNAMKNFFNKTGMVVLGVMLSGAVSATETITYFHNDVVGSPLVATDNSGNVVWKESYQPYGEQTQKQPASSNNQLWFAGKSYDQGTGLSYSGARYYDVVLGRFMGVDAVGFKESNIHSFNRYAYGNNNPYKYIDPDGNEPRVQTPRTDVYVFHNGKGLDFVAINGANGATVTGNFNMTTDNYNQLRPGNYTISPRSHVEEKTGVAGLKQTIGSMLSGNRDGNVNKHEGQPIISNTNEPGTVRYSDGKEIHGATIHPGRDANGEGGNSLGCLVCNTATFNKLNQQLNENYGKGGAELHIYGF